MADRIPEGWRECKIENLAKRITSGGTPLTKVKEYYGGEIPWLNTKEISFNRITDTEVKITKLGLNNSSAKWIDPNSVIVAMYGATAGKIAINKIPLTTNQACCNLTIDETIADYNFVYYCLRNSYDELENLASGAAQQNLNVGIISDFEILLPSLPEQHAIASVLGSLDDKIDLLNRENQTLEQMAEAIFRQWFIEEADEKWEEVPLSEVFDFKEGPGIRNWQYRDNGIPFINIRLISNGEIDVSKANFVSEAEANAKYKHFYLQRKDMVVSTSGTLGKVAIIRNYHLPLLLNTSVIRFRPKDGINFSFMYGYLRSNEFYECLIDSASGSVQLNFGPIHLKQIVMKIPPNEKLEYFRKVVDPIYEKFELNYNQIRTLEKLRDTLLPKLMSGEVRVKLTDSEVQK